MQKRQILINAAMSVVQIVVISTTILILYSFLLNTIGVEQLGIWSLVLATTSVSQIANFGLSGSVVKFVAKYVALKEEKKISGVIQTAAISVGIFVGVILVASYPIVKYILRLVITEELFPAALSILPFAFLALWIMVIVSVFLAGLDGHQRIDLRSLLLMGGAVIHLLLCFFLVPSYGLLGLAYARVIQNIVILFFSWLLLKKCLFSLPIIPYKWDKFLFKEMVKYGLNFQVISIVKMLCDPTTKALLSKFGGLTMVGYYEMANKIIHQIRALIVSANQVLVPTFADLKERTPEKIKSVYLSSYNLLFFITLPLYSLIIICAPLISELWIGHMEKTFVLSFILLAIGRFFNILEGPAYFANLGIGKLRWNVISHLLKATLNTSLGIVLGILFGGIGVVTAWVISLIVGSLIICFSYHKNNKIYLRYLIPKSSIPIIFTCLLGLIVGFVVRHSLMSSFNTLNINILIVSLFLAALSIFVWRHPMRKHLMGWIHNELINNKIGA